MRLLIKIVGFEKIKEAIIKKYNEKQKQQIVVLLNNNQQKQQLFKEKIININNKNNTKIGDKKSMGLKEEIYELMKDPKGITVDVIAKELEIPENAVNSYIWRLKKEGKITDDNIIDKIYLDKNKTKGKKYYRYRVLEKPKDKKNSESLKAHNDLIDKLVLLMIKAEINSEKYEINIIESEIEPSIKRLTKGGLIG